MCSLIGASKHAPGCYVLRDFDSVVMPRTIPKRSLARGCSLLEPGDDIDIDDDGSDNLNFGLTSAPATAQAGGRCV